MMSETTRQGGPEVPLYNACLEEKDLKRLLDDIRSTSYIDEVESGELPREESDLYDMVGIAKKEPNKTKIEDILKDSHIPDETYVVVIADDKSLKSVSIYYIKDCKVQDSMKTATKDVIEVCSNLLSGGVKIEDVSDVSVRPRWVR